MNIKAKTLTHFKNNIGNTIIPTDPNIKKQKSANIKKAILGNISHQGRNKLDENNKVVYEDKTLYRDEDEPHIVHEKHIFKKVKDATTPTLMDNMILNHPKVYEPIKIKILEFHELTDGDNNIEIINPKTMSSLRKYFNNDIIKIIDDILTNTTNFEEYPIQFKILGISVIEGSEKIYSTANNTVFQVPNPKAITYLIEKLLTFSYNLGYDIHKLTNIIINIFKSAASVNEGLKLLKQVFDDIIIKK